MSAEGIARPGCGKYAEAHGDGGANHGAGEGRAKDVGGFDGGRQVAGVVGNVGAVGDLPGCG